MAGFFKLLGESINRWLKYGQLLLFFLVLQSYSQQKPKILILTGNGNVPEHKTQYPPWIHEFQNDLVSDIIGRDFDIEITEDLSVLNADQLKIYDAIVSNSIFLTPSETQLNALYDFVAQGKSFLSMHCGILSFLNWSRYEEFMGGIFIGGPSDEPTTFKVYTTNSEFWGYSYSFRKQEEHPISAVTEDFFTTDELYYFQPGIRDFHVIARAENHPIMWWHPLGKGKVMSLTLGHDTAAKSNGGYQNLLINGLRWLTGVPLIHTPTLTPISTRILDYQKVLPVNAMIHGVENTVVYTIEAIEHPELFKASIDTIGNLSLTLSGNSGNSHLTVSASNKDGYQGIKNLPIEIVKDGQGNIAAYYGNMVNASSKENESALFRAENIIDNDLTTRWSSSRVDTASVMLDLTKDYEFSRVNIHWEAAYASGYSLEGSRDGKKWFRIVEERQGDGGTDEHIFKKCTARFVRIQCNQKALNRWGYSIYELEIFE